MRRLWAALCLSFVCVATTVATNGLPRVAAVSQPPVLNGHLDDPVWQQVEPIGELTQAAPVAGTEPSVATEVRMIQDGATLYVAVLARESPGYVRSARQTRRDAELSGDDHISLVFDSGPHQFSYVFGENNQSLQAADNPIAGCSN